MRLFMITVFVFSIPAIGHGATIHVPGDYPTTQQAIAVSSHGDQVVVDAGIYVENIDFLGKRITVESANGPMVTINDGNQSGSVCSFVSGETNDSVLEGFTIMNGSGTVHDDKRCGGGIFCRESAPVIRGNIIRHNQLISTYNSWGGGIYGGEGSITVEGNRIFENNAMIGGGICCANESALPVEIRGNEIRENESLHSGGGIYVEGGVESVIAANRVIDNDALQMAFGSGGGIFLKSVDDNVIVNNIIYGNHASGEFGHGGGGILLFQASVQVINNTIVCNYSSGPGGGIRKYSGYSRSAKRGLNIVNNIVRDNHSPFYGEEISPTTLEWVEYCNVKGGFWGTGNIDEDPQFVDFTNRDLHIEYTSPCRDAGTNSIIQEITDFEGDARITFGTADMGADEFHTHFYCTGDFTPAGAIEGKFVGAPWYLIPLGIVMPAEGVFAIPATLPGTCPDYFAMQALIGWELSNLFVLDVE